jgi:hypothetical protein
VKWAAAKWIVATGLIWLIAMGLLVVTSLLGMPITADIPTQNVSVNATPFTGVEGLTVTKISDTLLKLEWSAGVDVNNTKIVVKYGEYPEGRDSGYDVYFGNATSCNDTFVSLNDIFAAIYYEAHWQDFNGTWSPIYAQGNYGEEIVEGVADSLSDLATAASLLASVLFSIAILVIALWRKHAFLYLMAAPVTMTFGWYWAGEYGLIAGVGFAAIGGYCIYLAIRQFISMRG